jgi:hypothetical protein
MLRTLVRSLSLVAILAGTAAAAGDAPKPPSHQTQQKVAKKKSTKKSHKKAARKSHKKAKSKKAPAARPAAQ